MALRLLHNLDLHNRPHAERGRSRHDGALSRVGPCRLPAVLHMDGLLGNHAYQVGHSLTPLLHGAPMVWDYRRLVDLDLMTKLAKHEPESPKCGAEASAPPVFFRTELKRPIQQRTASGNRDSVHAPGFVSGAAEERTLVPGTDEVPTIFL